MSGEFHPSTGITPPKVAPGYATYRSPYGPKYSLNRNINGWTIKQATKLGATLGAFGGVAGVFAIFFFAEVPKVRNDIMVKIPIIGQHFIKEIPASDNEKTTKKVLQLTPANFPRSVACFFAFPHSTFACRRFFETQTSFSADYPNPGTEISYRRGAISKMVSSSELPADPAKALEYKDKGNKCFQSGDYEGAEVLYSKAIQHDPNNPLLYTNRSMALLKLSLYTRVVTDTQHAISLLPHNMKAYFQLAQAQMALQDPHSALISAKKAHAYCVEEVHSGGKGASSIGPITDLVLRCKREVWEEKERERERQRVGLLGDVINALEKQRRDEVQRLEGEDALEGEGMVERNKRLKEFEEKWDKKIENTRVVFERAELEERVKRRRKVPDWVVDNITFSVMLDPVVTNTGQSYDRSSIMQHLSRSPTDPLTREPLRPEDLRPNLALKAACEDFLEENGWAVDW